MGQAKANRAARAAYEAANPRPVACGVLDMSREVSPGYRDMCGFLAGHAGLHDWQVCGATEPTIDTYPDEVIVCERERGHDGRHRRMIEWGDA